MSFRGNCAHLFGLQPVRGHVNLVDVRDAMEVARSIPCKTQREAFYASQGLDMKRVEEFYPVVVRLNTTLQDHSGNQTWSVRLGAWELSITKHITDV